MTIDGVPQTRGGECVVDVAADDLGILLVFRDTGGKRERLIAPAEGLATALADHPAVPQLLAGTAGGESRIPEVAVRRNEVLLAVGTADPAVGRDDLKDAVGGAAGGGS